MRKVLFTALIILITVQGFAQELSSQYEVLDKSGISEVFERAESITFLRSVSIQQKNELLGERYFNGASPDYPYNIKSASKSIISLLTGIAIEEGFISSVDEPISEYFPEYFERNPDSVKANITIKNLLSMQTGLETTSRENYGKWISSENWAEYVLSQPLTDEPGGEMTYSTGVSHLLAIIVAKASGMNTRNFAEKYLFDPLEIQAGNWDLDPQGNYMGGNNVALTPSDLLKIGQMILDSGFYNGKRVVSSQWLLDSFKTYATSPINSYNYGYMWWNRTLAGFRVYFAWGFGGQFIFLVPQLDAVVVITSKIYPTDEDREYQHPIFDLLEHHILPALSDFNPARQ